MGKIIITFFLFLCFNTVTDAQYNKLSNTIKWDERELLATVNDFNKILKFEGVYRSDVNFSDVKAKFNSITYIPITEREKKTLSKLDLSTDISIDVTIDIERKKSVINYSFIPYRINPENNTIEKVNSYEIDFDLQKKSLQTSSSRVYLSNSLLNTGNWFKIKVNSSGIFKLTYSQLIQIGLSQPKNVRIYSYGGKQLPYANSNKNHDDLIEIPIKMFDGSDNIFNDGDYVIFYAEGTTTWTHDSKLDMFIHSKHNFSDYTYLFISDTEGSGGLKINIEDNQNLNSNYTTTSYDSYKCHEENEYNLIESGRTWYGERFRPGNVESYNFTFPNIISSENAKIYTSVVGRKQLTQTCYFNISSNGTELSKIDIKGTYGTYTFGHEYKREFNAINPSSNINLEYSFVGVNSNMEGYVDFVCINTRENLKMQGNQFMFRDKRTISPNQNTKFKIDNTGKSISVWNITNAVNAYELKLSVQNNESSFIIQTDSLQQFIAFDGSNYLTPIIEGEDLGQINNQNLHGIGNYDMIIITHPKFLNQANELADIHRNHDNLSVFVTQPQLIYNEFSSGTSDISAIRNFMRMLYDKASTTDDAPKYLLLFGDGSYDNWNTDDDNSNMIPTYQSINSISETASHVSDDYYALLDNGEGEVVFNGKPKINGKLDVGVGRFPVQTVEEAQLMVDKVKHYLSSSSYGDWRTKICFIGDDGDSQLHQRQADYLSNEVVRVNFPEFNSNKIYLDSYNQISTPSGQRYPDVTKAINEQVEKGALIINYVGHGNPRILAHEEILTTTDVRDWSNWDKLSIFVTASCEVGRFDDFEQMSLGEWFIMNPDGGGIATITTTRVVYSGENFELSKTVFQNALNSKLRLGDIIRIAKNERSSSGINHRNFTLLGDPALKIAVPENKIIIGNINGKFLPQNSINSTSSTDFNSDLNSTASIKYMPGDTIRALSKTKIEGYIDDKNGNALNKDGILYITIYDKIDTIKVTAQDNAEKTLTFDIQNKILYKGKASITQGYFEFEFIVPKDINYKFGKGKISLYAILDSEEAIGYSDNIVIGGNAEDIASDYDGPQIDLFINDTLFINGGITSENPILIAKLKDETGINTTGNGFGHNITAILDGNQDNIYILNNYFEGNIDKYNSGEIKYPFTDLSSGYHYITVKTWDIHNNSAESTLEFYVHESNTPIIENLMNSPNPFNNETWFTFEHNQSFIAFDVSIKIYDIMGNMVTEINQDNIMSGHIIDPIYWDATNSSGSKLPKGVYIYHTEITATDGRKTYKSSKLIII